MQQMPATLLRAAISGSLLLIAPVLGAYIATFGSAGLSEDQGAWGQFGDYVGGTLNPLFAFLAFVGVLFTLNLQAAQLKLVRHQSELEELQRLIGAVSKEVDALLEHKPSTVGDSNIANEELTLSRLLAGVGTAVLNSSEHAEAIGQRTLPRLALSINAVEIELHQLVWVLNEYEKAGGSRTVVSFYRKRYEMVVLWMHLAGRLSNARLEAFFEPRSLTAKLRAGT